MGSDRKKCSRLLREDVRGTKKQMEGMKEDLRIRDKK